MLTVRNNLASHLVIPRGNGTGGALKLTPKGLAMIEDSLSEEETDKEIKEGTKGDHPWIWRHRNTAGHGKEYDYHSE